jgi:ABC-2 type transport system permease protein
MKGALWVCERDVRKFLRQPSLLLAGVVGPFITLVLLGFAFGGTITHVPLAVVNNSMSPTSYSFIDLLRNDQNCAYGGVDCANAFTLTTAPDLDVTQALVRTGAVKAAVYIPSQFGLVINDSVTPITVYIDNTDPLSAVAISGLLAQAGSQISSQIQVTGPSIFPATIDMTNMYRQIFYIEFMAPGSLIQALMFASIIGGGISILFDKQRGIIEGYLVTPLKQYEIVVGVLLAGVIKATFSAFTILALAILFVGVRPVANVLDYGLVFFTIFLTALGIISMMTAYAVRAPTPEVYQFTAFPIDLILYFTSGAVYPLEGFPSWMRTIATLNPEVYAIHALRLAMYKGATLSAVAGDFVPRSLHRSDGAAGYTSVQACTVKSINCTTSIGI